MDIRELFPDHEEVFRTLLDGLRKHVWTVLPVIVNEDSKDGHTVVLKSAVKGQLTGKDGKVTHVELPLMGDVPIFYPQGSKNVSTSPVKKGDEGIIVFAGRPIDLWHKMGDVQQAIDTRIHSLSDGMFLPGVRSDPRKLKNVSTDSQQHRDESGRQTVDVHESNGVTIKAVDPSDSAENPYKDAQRYHQSRAHPTDGVEHRAQSPDTFHRVTVDHDNGSRVMSEADKHVFAADLSGLRAVTEKVFKIASNLGTTLTGGMTGDKGMFSLLGFGLSGGGSHTLGVDSLGGDLSGPLPDPLVVGITHIKNAHLLPHYSSEAEAQADGLRQGQLFRSGPIIMVNTLPDPES